MGSLYCRLLSMPRFHHCTKLARQKSMPSCSLQWTLSDPNKWQNYWLLVNNNIAYVFIYSSFPVQLPRLTTVTTVHVLL